MIDDRYIKQVTLLLEILPTVMESKDLALKGGTAINLFYRDMPRLSVDIDLCYLPIEDRDLSFKNIHNILSVIKEKLVTRFDAEVKSSRPLNGQANEAKLFVSRGDVEVKVEPNYILRGAYYDPVLAKNVGSSKKQFDDSFDKEQFGLEMEVKCLNFAEIYGGKICAALDRQHPRDLFDVKILLENEGITTEIKDAFIYFLLSHNRPIHELLNPNVKILEESEIEQFAGMTKLPVDQKSLQETTEKLKNEILKMLSVEDRKFLISFFEVDPQWNLIPNDKIKDYPSIKWKLYNQKKMDQYKRRRQVEMLKRVLSQK